MDIVFLIILAYIDRAIGFKNYTNMSGVHRMYYYLVSKAVSRNCGRWWSVIKLCEDVFAFKNKVVNMFLPICTHGLFTIKFHLLNYPIKDISRFRGLSAIDASPLEQFNTSIKAAYHLQSK